MKGNSSLVRKPDAFTPENILALDIPDNLKNALIAFVDIREDFFAMRMDRVWVQIVNTMLLSGYKEHRREWIKLFARNPREHEPVKGVYDALTTPARHQDADADFIGKPCEGCTK